MNEIKRNNENHGKWHVKLELKNAYDKDWTQDKQVISAPWKTKGKQKNVQARFRTQVWQGKGAPWKTIEKKWKLQTLESNQRAHGSRCAQKWNKENMPSKGSNRGLKDCKRANEAKRCVWSANPRTVHRWWRTAVSAVFSNGSGGESWTFFPEFYKMHMVRTVSQRRSRISYLIGLNPHESSGSNENILINKTLNHHSMFIIQPNSKLFISASSVNQALQDHAHGKANSDSNFTWFEE